MIILGYKKIHLDQYPIFNSGQEQRIRKWVEEEASIYSTSPRYSLSLHLFAAWELLQPEVYLLSTLKGF